MSKHGLTRVRFDGDKVIIVAGAIPEEVAAKAVEVTPVKKPTPVRIPTKPLAPARVPAAAKVVPDAKPQAEPAVPAEEKK